LIAEAFARIRETLDASCNITRSQPITPRSIEALIRVSTAHAKIRMSEHVEAVDTQVAIDLIEYAYFGVNQLNNMDTLDMDTPDIDTAEI